MNAIIPRVLLVDDDNESSRLIAGRLKTRAYDAKYAGGIGDALIADAAAKARAFYPHVIVLDWRLHGPYNEESACEALMEVLPRCGMIIYSEFETLQDAGHVMERFHAYSVEKDPANPDLIIATIERVLTEQCGVGRRPDDQPFDVAWSRTWQPATILERVLGRETRAPEDLLEGLLWQLFKRPVMGNGNGSSAGRISLLDLDGSVHSLQPPGPQRAGPGHSVVLAAELSGQSELVVLKVAEKGHIERERRNFESFVDRNIHGGFYSILRNNACFHDLGALEYTLVGGPLTGVSSFAAWVRDNDAVPRIVKPLKHFFGTAWRSHYQNSQPYDRPLGEYGRTGNHQPPRTPGWRACLYDLYDPSLRLGERIRTFPDQGARQPAPGLPGLDLPNPMAWLQLHGEDSVVPGARVAITHGDLHCGNLLVDEQHGWAIDFERTGWGHWLRDFVELEVDLLTRLLLLPAGEAPARFLRLAVALTNKLEPDPGLLKLAFEGASPVPDDTVKVVRVVTAVRRLMNQVARPVDEREYLWGLLLDAAFAAAWAPEGSEARARALLLGGVICDRLEHGAGRWPLHKKVLAAAGPTGLAAGVRRRSPRQLRLGI